ncbi:MAG: thioredoxin family protein, partial [Candidatus Caldarchaeum sp.]
MEGKLEKKVTMNVFTQEFECQYCREMRELAGELQELADGKIKLNVYDFEKDAKLAEKWGVDKIPALLLHGEREYNVRFFGLPAGYEFITLIEDLIDVSKGYSRLSPAVRDRVSKIDKPVHIQVFVTPTCPYCPRAVRTAHQMAIENNLITADMVEVIEFPHLATKYDVMAVPKVVINDK